MRVGVISLGCPKNLVDTEVMLGRAAAAGHQISPRIAGSDVVIVNTCGFIDAARDESLDAIREVADAKARGDVKKLIVAGCLVQRSRDWLREQVPSIDGFVTLNDVDAITEALEHPDTERPVTEATFLYDARAPRILATPRHTAYLKISEGCDNPCAFCAIPNMRGRLRSRSVDDVVREAEHLAADGVREAILISQDATAFGDDQGSKDRLADLLFALNEVKGLDWIRVMYTYPNHFSDRMLEAYAACDKVVKYLDMPLQHADRGVLKMMKRGGDRAVFTKLLDKVRARVPDMVLRTTFIVGHPGEDAKAFNELLAFVEDVKFHNVGVFAYSPEEGTSGFAYGDPVSAAAKTRRRNRIMAAQQAISLGHNRALVGRTVPVLMEGLADDRGLLRGRTAGQAPEIDGVVLVTEGFAKTGTIAPVRITGCGPYDLEGSVESPLPAPPSTVAVRKSLPILSQ